MTILSFIFTNVKNFTKFSHSAGVTFYENYVWKSMYIKSYQLFFKSFYDIILNNKEGEPIGFLGIQYVHKCHKSYNNNDREEVLRLKFFIEEKLEKMIK